MALMKQLKDDNNGMITSYHKIEKAMVNYIGEGSIEITIAEYADKDVRDRQKAGEMTAFLKEHNEYIPLGDISEQSFDRAILYQRLIKETETYAEAEDC